MSYETNHCNRIVCDYPDCDATTRLWREDEDSAYSDADDLKWLTIEVELDGDEYVDRHFCPRHLDTTRPEWASEYILPDVLARNGWNVLGFGTMFPPKGECAPVIAGVLEKADACALEHIRTRGWSVPPWPCIDARTIVPTASPTTVDSCCGGMGCPRMSATSIRIVSFRCWRLFWTTRRKLCYSGCVHT